MIDTATYEDDFYDDIDMLIDSWNKSIEEDM